MKQLGYTFVWQLLDTQLFLLPQRRTRVWGVADLMSNITESELSTKMKATIESMTSDIHFQYDKVFDTTRPKEKLTNKVQKSKLKQAIQTSVLNGNGDDVFIDCSTSKSRNCEFSNGVSTCIRPSHRVYSNKLQRFLTTKELWCCQGLWADSFANPDAVKEIMKSRTPAQDMAGVVKEYSICSQLLVEMFQTYIYSIVCIFKHFFKFLYIYTYIVLSTYQFRDR